MDNSLLHIALTCRRTHSLVMRDGPWWRQQQLHLTLRRPLIPLHKWTRILSNDDNGRAVMVQGFGVRQQAILRRLLGDAVFEREVAPKLPETRSVM